METAANVEVAAEAARTTSVAAAVVATARAMLDAFEVFDTLWRLEWGLSPSEKLVVTHLWAKGSASMTDISDRIGMTSGGVTSLVDRLERDGYLRRETDPKDRRRQLVTLTDKGNESRAELQRTLEVAVDFVSPSAAEPILEALRAHFDAGADVIRRRLEDSVRDAFPVDAPASE